MPLSSKEILRDLIAFPTISNAGNRELIKYASRLLAGAGFQVRLVEYDENRLNLFASYGPADRRGVIFSAHSDVVPVEGQAWDTDPFTLVEKDGRLFGRGTADMKGFIACLLHAAQRIGRYDLQCPVHISLSCAEEIGCVGVRPLLEQLGRDGIDAAFCLVGEPTSMAIARSHKGKVAVRVTCIGTEAHSAYAPLALNAIYLATDLIGELRALQNRLAMSARSHSRFDIPHTTIHVGRIDGGIALNLVPARCSFDFEIRNIPEDDAAGILTEIRCIADHILSPHSEFDQADIRIEEISAYPALRPDDSDAIESLVSMIGANDEVALSFGTEAGLFTSTLHVPTIVCGPGSMDQGHKPNEYVAVEQLERCDAMLTRLLLRLSSAHSL